MRYIGDVKMIGSELSDFLWRPVEFCIESVSILNARNSFSERFGTADSTQHGAEFVMVPGFRNAAM